MIAPYKKPPSGEPGEAVKGANKSVNRRYARPREQIIAHIESWRISPAPTLPPPLETFEQTITAVPALYAFKITP